MIAYINLNIILLFFKPVVLRLRIYLYLSRAQFCFVTKLVFKCWLRYVTSCTEFRNAALTCVLDSRRSFSVTANIKFTYKFSK